MKYEKPNLRLMAELYDVRDAVDDVYGALQRTNWLPENFEKEALSDFLNALYILPDGTAAGAHTTLRATKTELQDFEDRHFLTQAGVERAAQNSQVSNNLSRQSELGKQFRLLKSAVDSALSECRRQAGTQPDEEEPPINELRHQVEANSELALRTKQIALAMQQAHSEIDEVIDSETIEKDIVKRIIKDTEHLSLTTRAVTSLKSSSAWVGNKIAEAWRERYRILSKAMTALKNGNDLTKYGLDRWSKIKKDLRHVGHKNFSEIADDIQNWADLKNIVIGRIVKQPDIPEVALYEQITAEEVAKDLLKSGKKIPRNTALKVRSLLFGNQESLEKFSSLQLLEHCKYLEKIELPYSSGLSGVNEISSFKYLKKAFLDGSDFNDLKALSSLQYLSQLSLYNTKIKNIEVLSKFTNLTHLDIGSTAVSDMSSISKLVKLEYLDFSRTKVSDCSFLRSLINLNVLVMRYSEVNDISHLSNLKKLFALMIDGLDIFDASPLSTLSELKVLDISQTSISDLTPLKELQALNHLIIDDTPIRHLSVLEAMKGLEYLSLKRLQPSKWPNLTNIDTIIGHPNRDKDGKILN